MRPYPKPEKINKEEKILTCKKCGSNQVVNRTHSLCFEHNQERLKGKDWRKNKIESIKKIKPVSIKKSKIKNALNVTYKLIDQSREPQCESCGAWHSSKPLSHSHTISEARCIQLGKTELITDEQNIIIECFEAPTSSPTCCHNIWESGTIQQKMNLKTFEQKLNFIKQHDEEAYQKFLIQIKKV